MGGLDSSSYFWDIRLGLLLALYHYRLEVDSRLLCNRDCGALVTSELGSNKKLGGGLPSLRFRVETVCRFDGQSLSLTIDVLSHGWLNLPIDVNRLRVQMSSSDVIVRGQNIRVTSNRS